MNIKELSYWLAAIHLPGIGPHTVIQWLSQFTDMQSIFCASRDEQLAKGLSRKAIEVIKQVNWQQIENELAWAELADHHLVSLIDPNYPPLLKEIPDPPLVLFVQGNKSA